jgi:hypothetical protein
MARVIFAIASLAALMACGTIDHCGNTILEEVQSPTGKYRAVIFRRDCGATTGCSTQVSVLNNGETFFSKPSRFKSSSQSNCFVCDQTFSGPDRQSPLVKAHWISPTKVEIQYDKLARTFMNNTQSGAVTVVYKLIDCSRFPVPRNE